MGRPTKIGPDMETADSGAIDTAMVLAAGFGSRMRPLTDRVPKPLLRLAGRALIDHALDRLAEAGIERAVVNVHHFAGQVEAHLRGRAAPQITISDERAASWKRAAAFGTPCRISDGALSSFTTRIRFGARARAPT